jgi:hypothetical protein
MQVVAPPVVAATPVRWKPATRVAFRFCFIYFGLYVLLTQMISGLLRLPVVGLAPPGTFKWPRAIVEWTASHVFHITRPLVIFSGSGDKVFDWVQVFCLLVVALAGSAVWSLLATSDVSYDRLDGWFRVFLRFALGSTMVSYGLSKVIPGQMPAPALTQLLEPFGNFSPMGVLWSSIGASPAYESFTGCAEVLAGVLLFVPRVSLLGALVALADAVEIFALNMTYDVPVKLLSFHLILISLWLLAPDAKRLANVLVLNRAAAPRLESFWKTARAARVALIAQVAFGAYLFLLSLGYNVLRASASVGAPRSPLYGIWIVDEMAMDGTVRSPLVNDYERWRRVVFPSAGRMVFQRMDDTFVYYRAGVDEVKHVVALTLAPGQPTSALLTYERPARERLTLDGNMNGHRVHMALRLFDDQQFLLKSRGFHWVQEYPFNR